MNSENLTCPFRFNLRRSDSTEVATCGLIQQLLQLGSNGQPSDLCDVTREACQACVGSTPVASSFVNSVFPSLLSEAAAKSLQREPAGDPLRTQRAQELLRISEEAVVGELAVRHQGMAACDVFLCCHDASEATRRSIESVLDQQNTLVHLHLITDGPDARALAHDYATRWNVHVHPAATAAGWFDKIHELVPTARSEFIAFQHPGAFSLPNRIAAAVGELRRTGADFIGSPLSTPAGDVMAREPTDAFESTIPWPTLVLRRSCFIDLGGFANRKSDQDVELIARAKRSGAKIQVMPLPSVQLQQPWQPPVLGPAPVYSERLGSFRHHAIGYPQSTIQCDVVLPVYGQLEYVAQAIESVIDQQGAEVILHLIDDAGPENVDTLFRYWGSFPNVRIYRNSRNVGQYVSFNNVSPYFETELVAVQDGDDLSLPHRLHTAGNLLRLSDADYFAATMEQFVESDMDDADLTIKRCRRSYHPYGNHFTYFAMNPTACFRVSLFRRLGGYSDFGSRDRNRGGLDSEFMIRALFSAARFAFSTSIVARHRIHRQAATRHPATGFGSATRAFALEECRRRLALYQRTAFDPRAFGALGNDRNVTQRVQ